MKKLVLYIFILLCCFSVFAQNHTLTAKKGVIKQGYNFWVYTPENYATTQDSTPLIIFLHGASLRGNNLDKVLKYGPLHALNMGREIPAIILAPQNPSGAWKPNKVNDMLEWVKKNYKFDTNRIYVIGMSLGCYGTLDFVGTYPEKVAAAMAICGSTSLNDTDMQKLGNVPLWIIHGKADKTIPISYSKKIVNSLINKKNDTRLLYTWLDGYNHYNIAKILYIEKTYNWLLSHSLTDENRAVNTSIVITGKDLQNAYSDLNKGAKKPARK
ncbi:MAG: dienelactone hydrolase family protein [Bacteroidales bacterium]|nr:dienelactone hydrolase family protein [Bacteroidales bacterium]